MSTGSIAQDTVAGSLALRLRTWQTTRVDGGKAWVEAAHRKTPRFVYFSASRPTQCDSDDSHLTDLEPAHRCIGGLSQLEDEVEKRAALPLKEPHGHEPVEGGDRAGLAGGRRSNH